MIAVLIALTAFFVASEFAIVKARSSRIDFLVAEGNKRAISVKTIISNLDEYLSACKLGITITALGLGVLGIPTIQHLLHTILLRTDVPPSILTALSFLTAFILITFFHVVLGKLVTKTIAIQKAEAIILFVARPLILFYQLQFPFIWILNSSARLITGLFGLYPASEREEAHSEEELRFLVSESYKSGEINQSEYKYVNKIFEFDERVAKEIMVPRTEMMAVDKDKLLSEIMEVMSTEKYTRYPVIHRDKDHIAGMINFKDVFTDFITRPESKHQRVEEFVRPIIQVIESISIHDLFVKMQKERTHMAILVDEYGGTSGLVTVEDILEQIVGEIQDEFDTDEQPEIQEINEYKTLLEGKVLVSEVNDLFCLTIDDTDVDTIGGWFLTEYFEIKEGDCIEIEGLKFRVVEMEGRYIKRIEVTKPRSKAEVISQTTLVSLKEQITSS
ncbi:HlyC/CorC family transporter [Bacillus sp. 165]|nr:HlyC/CorC family transporter [Bacillus sp. 165]